MKYKNLNEIMRYIKYQYILYMLYILYVYQNMCGIVKIYFCTHDSSDSLTGDTFGIEWH